MYRTTSELAAAIEEEAGLDVAALPKIGRLVWHARRTPMEVSLLFPIVPEDGRKELLDSMNPTDWRVNGPVPFNAGMVVFAIFEDADEARVYALPAAEADAKSLGPPTLYKLSKLSQVPLFSQQSLSLEAFKEAVANEWLAVEEDFTTAEKERDAVLEYLESLPANYSVKQAVLDIQDEKHLDSVDDDEDETQQNGQNAVLASAPSPVENLLRESVS